jgi:hypothetical protein
MNWKFWDKKMKELDEESSDILVASNVLPLSTLFRWYCYDTGVDNPNQFAEAFGLTPISEEGEELELEESEKRIEAVEPYAAFLNIIADINAMVLSETIGTIFEKHGLELDEELEVMQEVYAHVAFGALISAFASALNLGLIINPGSYTQEVDPEDEQ